MNLGLTGVHVGHREAHRGDAGAEDEASAEAGFLDQPGAHAVAAPGHDLEAGLVEKAPSWRRLGDAWRFLSDEG
jgi:hypothetical protein